MTNNINSIINIHPEMAQVEKNIVLNIIHNALLNGYTVSVNDGVETVVSKSKDRCEIFSSMFSTGSDTLFLDFNNGFVKKSCWISLIYGNGQDIVSDYSDNSYVESILDGVEDEYHPCITFDDLQQ